MRQMTLVALVAAGLLVGCGGGGGSDSADGGAAVNLSGTAAKGLMADATVTVHAAKADGTVDDTPLATTTTNAQGFYSLAFDGTKDQPYVVRVTAGDGTTHLDELTGEARPLAPGFQMRSLVVPAATGSVTTSASITPFSEMAVAAAQRTSAGINAASAAQAVSAVSQLLGFNPVTASVVPASEATTVEQQQMAVLLAAVSQLASDGALGCETGDAAARTRCVVETLAASASTETTKLTAGTTDVSQSLAAAVNKVFDNPTAVATIPRATVEVAVSNLNCTTNCQVAATTPGTGAIAAARALFVQLKTDIATVFLGSGTDASTGPARTEALAFENAMRDVQVPAELVANDLGVLLMGADLYHDYHAGRTSVPTRGRAQGFVANDALGMMAAANCSLYQDSATTLPATAPDNANYVGCSANYYMEAVTGATTRWRHGFALTPTTDGFTYQARARRTCFGTACVEPVNVSLQDAGYQGTLTTTLTETHGRVIGFAVSGQLPGAFAQGGNTLVDAYSSWELQGTRTISGFKQEVSSLSGTIISHAADETVRGTLTINAAKLTEIPMTALGTRPTDTDPATQGDIAEVEFDLVWRTAAAEFAGVLKLADSQWDASGTMRAPTTALLSGSLRNIVGGTPSEFAAGALTATVTGIGEYDDLLPTSSTNTFTVETTFTGSISAPGRPKLELTVAGAAQKHDAASAALSVQYRTIVNGTPRTVVTVTRSVSAEGASTIKLAEATANLSLEWTEDAPTAALKSGDTTIGSLDVDSARLTFSDNTFMSLDLGL
jgi:hypothetical protein